MVTSASIDLADRHFQEPFYYTYRQGMGLCLGWLGAMLALMMPIQIWYRFAASMMIMAIVLLVLVLIPGPGKIVNGSARWLNLGITAFQVSELAKLSVVIYLSSYIVRHPHALRENIQGFIRPMLLLSIVGALLVLEPDFGATVVILVTALAMLFLSGVPLWQFLLLLLAVLGILGGIAVSAPYRLERLVSFLDPWAVAFDSGYQLTQALIAFGRGEWCGVGLGSSIQKLFYLPEAHTDFVFAVLAEELGLLGALGTMGLYALFVWRGMIIGASAERRGDRFAAFVAYGISLWVGIQTMINIGVNTGVLPTKGLTLPFLSYGGSSVSVIGVAVGLLLRVDYENRTEERGILVGHRRYEQH